MVILSRLLGRDRARAALGPMPQVPRTIMTDQSARRAPTMPPVEGQRGGQRVLREAFTPTRPQRNFRRIAGRRVELTRIFSGIVQERAHIVLYGERGRGKTSLVNVVATAARTSGYMVARYACSAESTFDEIVRGLARDLPSSLLAVPLQENAQFEGCEAALPAGSLQPRDVASLPGRLAGSHLLVIVDEFDRVLDAPTRTRFADTIKQISDRGVAVTFVIVGVSDSLDELLGRHPSIQRNIVGVSLPLLTDVEIREIIELGAAECGLGFPAPVSASIVELARGVPYVAQLLGLHAASAAVARGADTVHAADLHDAIIRAVVEVDPRVGSLYAALTHGQRDAGMAESLLAIAAGEWDNLGRFTAFSRDACVVAAGAAIPKAHWERLAEMEAVRACVGTAPGVFTFSESMLPHHILLQAVVGTTGTAEPERQSGTFI